MTLVNLPAICAGVAISAASIGFSTGTVVMEAVEGPWFRIVNLEIVDGHVEQTRRITPTALYATWSVSVFDPDGNIVCSGGHGTNYKRLAKPRPISMTFDAWVGDDGCWEHSLMPGVPYVAEATWLWTDRDGEEAIATRSLEFTR